MSGLQTRNSAIADKPRDAFLQVQYGVADLLKTRPSPYVLPCRTWSFCVKENRQNWGALKHHSLGIGLGVVVS